MSIWLVITYNATHYFVVVFFLFSLTKSINADYVSNEASYQNCSKLLVLAWISTMTMVFLCLTWNISRDIWVQTDRQTDRKFHFFLNIDTEIQLYPFLLIIVIFVYIIHLLIRLSFSCILSLMTILRLRSSLSDC